jgi:NSS family neurotransmitter:Na+ symporter
MFVVLPVAFGNMLYGEMVAMAFFLMVILAAWSSTISILEPAVAYFSERFNMHRISASLLIGTAAWLLGLGSVFSFNEWAQWQLLWGMNFFATVEFVSANILLPLGGFLIALYVGWIMTKEQAFHEFKYDFVGYLGVWRWVLRYISPIAVLAILINGIYPVLTSVLVE